MDQLALDLRADGLHLGREAKRRALERMGRHQWVREARAVAAKIAAERGYVTSDDIHERCPKPAYLHDNVMGAVMCAPYFYKGSETPTRRRQGHARYIHKWHLTSEGEKLLWAT